MLVDGDGDGELTAMDVTRGVLDRLRARGGTEIMVTEHTTTLRTLLYWGYLTRERYFTAERAELLPAFEVAVVGPG